METKHKGDRYEVVFCGTAAEGERRIEVMRDVKRALNLDEQRVISLFARSGERVLYRTDERSRAESLDARLRHAGARSKVRDTHKLAAKDWKSWELIDKPEAEFHAFHCNACNHALRLPLSEPLPAVCPECGVVAAKYHAVEQKKLKRERMRRKVMDIRKAREEKAAAAAEAAEEAALRKQIEREVRREVQRELGLGHRLRNGVAAGVIFAIGAGSAAFLMQDPEGLPRETTLANDSKPATALPVRSPARAQQVTMHLADGLLRKLAVPAAGLDGNPVAAVTTDDEPWLTLPPTAAGPARPAPAVTAQPQTQTSAAAVAVSLLPYSVGDAELALMITHWQNHASAAPLTRLRLRRVTQRLLTTGKPQPAAQAALLATDPASRLSLLLPVIKHVASEPDHRRRAEMSQRVRTALIGQSDDDLALAQWLLDRMPQAGALDSLLPQALPGTVSAQLSRLTVVERIALYAQLAVYLGENSAHGAAQTWFDAANALLRPVTDPPVELVALAHLARAYYRANDHHAASDLLVRIGAALPALPGRPDARLLSEVLESYAVIGKVDDAVAVIEGMGETTLDALLTQADLALRLATADHGIAARALVAEITDSAVRARALAWLSAAAREQGRMQAAAGLALQARDAASGLRRELLALVEGELTGPQSDKVTAATILAAGDDYHAQLAMTLAWQQAFSAAHSSALAVHADLRRERLLRDLDTLRAAFSSLSTQVSALPQTSAG